MKITSLYLKNFKRFNDLQIQNIPNNAKLILLIGSNGVGKSSIFDAFSLVDGVIKRDAATENDFKAYFKKKESQSTQVQISFDQYPSVLISDAYFNAPIKGNRLNYLQTLKLSLTQRLKLNFKQLSALDMFYDRTSFRQIARLTRTSLGQTQSIDNQQDTDRPKFFIDRDNRFENDIEKMTEIILKDLFALRKSGEEWTASHSLGFIEYAKQSEEAIILDFDNFDFDLPRVLTPEPKENPEIYEIAVGKAFLPDLFQHLNLFFVENKDHVYYAEVGIPKTVFISENNRNNVFHKARTSDMKGIVDRDFLTDEDILWIRQQYPNLYILPYYSIENYLYHPDNLLEFYQKKQLSYDKKQYIEQLIRAKNEVKDAIVLEIVSTRATYPYFGEPIFNNKPAQNRFKIKQENYIQAAEIQKYLNSNELEIFYKVLQMKIYCTQVPQRQNIAKAELAKTDWFKHQISKLLS